MNITEQLQRINEFLATQEATTDQIVTGVAGITADVTALKDEIKRLIESADFPPESQAALDAIESRTASLSARLQIVGADVKALDEATPPKAE